MSTAVTKESLIARIADLEYGARSLKEDFTLAAYKMLLATMDSEPVAWRYRYTKPGVTDSQGEPWVGDWQYVDDKDNCNPGENYERQPLYRHAQPALDDGALRELFDAWFASDCSFDLSPEASEADNIAWRESYWYVWKRCRSAMLNQK